jgi:hypothetical protein
VSQARPASSKGKILSVEEFVIRVREDSAAWPVEQPRWFRGEPGDTDTPLLPSLYRYKDGSQRENQLLQTFRARSSAFSSDPLPDRKQTDKWLFLAQHVGLPTRLLDWSEGALIALYFALQTRSDMPCVWMLNPLHLNHIAVGAPKGIDPNILREFPLPWFNPKTGRNMANENMRGAWEKDGPGADLPFAIHPTYVHSRLRAQRGCFTVQGKKKVSLNKLIPESILKRYVIDAARKASLTADLAVLGVTESVAFPDLDGLAKDLRGQFLREQVVPPSKRAIVARVSRSHTPR